LPSDWVRIRRLEASDANAFFNAVRANHAHLAKWLDTPYRITSDDAAALAIGDPNTVRFGAFHRGDLKGSLKLMTRPPAEMGIWVTADAEGRGVGLLLALAALEFASRSSLGPILFCADRDNEASLRLRERVARSACSVRVEDRGREQCWHLSLRA